VEGGAAPQHGPAAGHRHHTGPNRRYRLKDRADRARNSEVPIGISLDRGTAASKSRQRRRGWNAGLAGADSAVTLAPVPQSSEYVATIKSRRSATMLPQVSGMLTQILVHSGDHVKAGQTLMEIDPRQQQATVDSAARHGTAEEGALRLQHGRGRAAAQAV
jgi:multidrug efflux pump subunit AcrA (membrane-fusion protein)